MDITLTAADSAINHDDPRQANLAKQDPLYNRTTSAAQHTQATPVGRAHRRERRQPARHMQRIPEE